DLAAQGGRSSSHGGDGGEEHDMSGKSQIDRRGFFRNAGGAALGAAATGGIAPLSPPAPAPGKVPARDIHLIIFPAPGGSLSTTSRRTSSRPASTMCWERAGASHAASSPPRGRTAT